MGHALKYVIFAESKALAKMPSDLAQTVMHFHHKIDFTQSKISLHLKQRIFFLTLENSLKCVVVAENETFANMSSDLVTTGTPFLCDI